MYETKNFLEIAGRKGLLKQCQDNIKVIERRGPNLAIAQYTDPIVEGSDFFVSVKTDGGILSIPLLRTFDGDVELMSFESALGWTKETMFGKIDQEKED